VGEQEEVEEEEDKEGTKDVREETVDVTGEIHGIKRGTDLSTRHSLI